MSDNGPVSIQICGFGGQGVVLSSIVFGTAAVTQANLYAAQTQSYGSEARGGECQAELLVSKEPIGSPLAQEVDILVAMSQLALDRYIVRLTSGGRLILVSDMVRKPSRIDIEVFEIPAMQIAEELGAGIAMNMVVAGSLQHLSGLITSEQLIAAIRETVPEKYLEVNLRAARRGMEYAQQQYGSIG